ncbi:LpxI family protein [Profundibacter sp.]
MSSALAILAGQGALPQTLSAAKPDALFVSFDGVDVEIPTSRHLAASFNKFGTLFDALKTAGITTITFAGGMSRPALDPAAFDAKTITLAPRLMAAMAGGDDGLLREIIAVFEDEGFTVAGAHQVLPDLVAQAGLLAGHDPDEAARIDAKRGIDILHALSPMDVGQGVVVAHGLCLGVETLQGTDAMLAFVAATPKHLRRTGGVFVKSAKSGQDLRVDMPAIGPDTVASVVAAGLGGIVIAAGSVMILKRAKTIQAIEAAGLFLLAI